MLPLKKIKNNLDPGQVTVVVFPDTMYTFRNIQGRGGQNIACTDPEVGKGPGPPWKNTSYMGFNRE